MIDQMEIIFISVWRGRRHELLSIRYRQLGMLSGDYERHDHHRFWRYGHLMDKVVTGLLRVESSPLMEYLVRVCENSSLISCPLLVMLRRTTWYH